MDLSLFRRRNFTVATIALLAAYGLFFGNVVLLPLWLQQYMGYTATLAGLVLAPVGVLAIFLSPLVGRFSDRFDPRVLVTISFAIFSLVLFMRAQFNTNATIGTLLIPTIIQGAAMAAFFIPLMSITLSGLPPERIPAASGLSNFARITAGSFGTSITTTLWDRRATLHHAQLVEHLHAADPVTSQALGTCTPVASEPIRATSCSTGWWTRRRSCCRRTTSSTPRGSLPRPDRPGVAGAPPRGGGGVPRPPPARTSAARGQRAARSSVGGRAGQLAAARSTRTSP